MPRVTAEGLAFLRSYINERANFRDAKPESGEDARFMALVHDIFVLGAALEPVPMLLYCPMCHGRHVDRGLFATKPHHTHSCQHCGFTWRPAIVDTVGVRFLPGFKDDDGLAMAVTDASLLDDTIAFIVEKAGAGARSLNLATSTLMALLKRGGLI